MAVKVYASPKSGNAQPQVAPAAGKATGGKLPNVKPATKPVSGQMGMSAHKAQSKQHGVPGSASNSTVAPSKVSPESSGVWLGQKLESKSGVAEVKDKFKREDAKEVMAVDKNKQPAPLEVEKKIQENKNGMADKMRGKFKSVGQLQAFAKAKGYR